MTAYNHGKVNQQPLYACAGCYEYCTWHADHLRVHNGECWCDQCWEECKEVETGVEYSDLPAYETVAAHQPVVQGEAGAVGWVWHTFNQTNFTAGTHHKEVLEADGVKLTPVYTAPQPELDVSALVEALDELANGYEGNAWDVGLVARLEKARAALATHRKHRGDV